MVNTEWDRDDVRFMEVDATVLLAFPIKTRFCATSSLGARWTDRPWTRQVVPRSTTDTFGSLALAPLDALRRS